MTNKVIIFVFLVIFWFAFSGKEEPFFIIGGLLSCLFALVIAIRLKLHKKIAVNGMVIPYSFWLIGEIIKSTLQVVKLTWSIKPKLSPNFITLNFDYEQEIFYVIFANSITLTPGTVTVLIEEKKKSITVHALDAKSAHDLNQGLLAAKINEVTI